MKERNPYAPSFDELPKSLAVFPLTGVLLLPHGDLPLNIFEPRYIKMLDDAMAGNRMIGVIQPRQRGTDKSPLHSIGCAGKIVEFSETLDGRYVVSLKGVSRFQVTRELDVTTPYRQIKADWSGYESDAEGISCLDLDRERLAYLLRTYFETQSMTCDWEKLPQVSDARLITCLSMSCPFDPKEKQALLETSSCKERSDLFFRMIEMAIHGTCSASKH